MYGESMEKMQTDVRVEKNLNYLTRVVYYYQPSW